ncbi:hypothetical protein Tco_1465908 [Tanacetum coccineum]
MAFSGRRKNFPASAPLPSSSFSIIDLSTHRNQHQKPPLSLPHRNQPLLSSSPHLVTAAAQPRLCHASRCFRPLPRLFYDPPNTNQQTSSNYTPLRPPRRHHHPPTSRLTMAAGIPPSSPHLHRYPRYHLHSMPPSPPSPPTVYHHLLYGTAVDTLFMPPTRHQQPPQIHLITHVNIITSAGLSTAKPPSWWRSDVGTATTAAPCGVGLWRRNPSGVPRCAQPLDATVWRRPSQLWPPQPPQPHHGRLDLHVNLPLRAFGYVDNIHGRMLGI